MLFIILPVEIPVLEKIERMFLYGWKFSIPAKIPTVDYFTSNFPLAFESVSTISRA